MGYGTDISAEEWAILDLFPELKQKGCPRKHSLRRIVDAIRYVQRTVSNSQIWCMADLNQAASFC